MQQLAGLIAPPQNSTNLKNRVMKLHLSKTKPLLPLFEVISNAMHAIQDKINLGQKNHVGKIEIEIIRNGDKETLKSLPDIESYPINSFLVTDNGIGFDSDNIQSFAEFDTEKKIEIGGKGVGRLVCLKAFQRIKIESIYKEGNDFKSRKFEYKKSKEGFENYEADLPTTKRETGTSVELHRYEDDYVKGTPTDTHEIAREIITHFQLYFIQGLAPAIILKNQNNVEINLQHLFNLEFVREVQQGNFDIGENNFRVIISKSFKAKSHKIHYCAHERTVKEEGIGKYLEDLKAPVISNDLNQSFFYQVFVVGDYLDKNVNEERTNFNFKQEEEDAELDLEEITLAKIRKETILSIENLLTDFLTVARKEKLDGYFPIVESDYPNYINVIKYNRSKVEKLPAGLSKAELDVKLYEIESQWRLDVKKEGVELLDKKKDITTLEEYTKLYDKFLSEFNDVGQADLARYMVHRRAVIDLLDSLIELNENQKFSNEDIVHSLFFPIRETKDSVQHEKQNLWLIDERMTFNTLLASDKRFKNIEQINSESNERMDLIIRKEEVFENAAIFAEEKIPFESFTIVEFKKPERDNYVEGDIEKDPVKQVRGYIEEIVASKQKLRGKSFGATKSTPFYCYIIADITPTLQAILDYNLFIPTADGLGHFKLFPASGYTAYIEVLPFKKVIKDAKQRNKILFDKLKLS